jgi:hypothetical protein
MYSHGQGVPQDYAQAIMWYRRAAEQGDATAQHNLGVMYSHSEGVSQDYAQAIMWYRRAAKQGNAASQVNLGVMYDNGLGVPQDYAQAAQWFRRAAEQGDASAQYNLGLMYDNGRGAPQDYAQAYLWYNLAAARLPSGADREKAVRNRDRMAAWLTPAQLADAQSHTRTWQPKPETPSARPPTVSLPMPVSNPPPISTPSPRREIIRQVQASLQAGGFNPGTIDGTMGPQTRDALRWFQNTKGLLPTGDLDEKTLDALGVR